MWREFRQEGRRHWLVGSRTLGEHDALCHLAQQIADAEDGRILQEVEETIGRYGKPTDKEGT